MILEETLELLTADLTEEEKERALQISKYLDLYHEMTDRLIPFQMPYTFEELKEAVEKKKPFQEWKKYKGWYTPVPDDWLL